MIVQTMYGKIEGIEENGIQSFKNIPYAAPPVGERRFRPPVKPASWEGIRDCTSWGSMCPQVPDENEVWQTTMSEDCLYLNVYTPAADNRKRPIYFYIHGGAFQTGAHNAWFKPDSFIQDDIICVTCNYRLGALGFFPLDEYLGEDYVQSGNSGLLDVLMALRWVQENIARFGGDPGNVTIMGQSAGSKMVATLLVMSKARGLFQKAVMESGSTQCIRDLDTAHRVVDKFMEAMGLTKETARELLTLPWERLIEKQGMIIAGLNNLHSCGPVFDGVNFDGDDALAIIESGKANYVDILGGFNRDEFNYYYDFCDMKKMDDTTLVNLFGKYAHYAKRTLERLVPEGDDRKMIDVVSKYLYGNATIQLFDAYAKAGRGNRLYLYRLDWDKMPMRAHHGIDSAFVMGDDNEWPGVETYEGFEELSATMLGAWKTFIKDACPQAPGMPEWPVYTADDKRLMRFDTTVEVIDAPKVDLDPDIPHQIFAL